MRLCIVLGASLLVGACVTPTDQAGPGGRPLAQTDPAVLMLVGRNSHSTVLDGGSAFLIASTLAVTARHVVQDTHEGRVLLASPGRPGVLKGRVVQLSQDSLHRTDLALVELDEPLTGVKPLTFAQAPTGNQPVLAAGYQISAATTQAKLMANERIAFTPAAPEQRVGAVVAGQSGQSNRWLQLEVDVERGFSGGPVLDACGRVVGVVSTRTVQANQPVMATAQSAQSVVDEVNRWRRAILPAPDQSVCRNRLPSQLPSAAPGPSPTPWPQPEWMPTPLAELLSKIPRPTIVPGLPESLVMNLAAARILSVSADDDPASVDRIALEQCEYRSGTPCLLVSRTLGTVPRPTPPTPQPRLTQRSPRLVPAELPFLPSSDAAWLAARFAERDPTRTAVVLQALGRGYLRTAEAPGDAVAQALAACRRDAPEDQRDGCFVVWDGVRTLRGGFSRTTNAESLRAALRVGRPLDAAETLIDGISRTSLATYIQREGSKALALDPVSTVSVTVDRADRPADAERLALEACEYRAGRPCRLIARGDVALPPAERTPPRPQPRLHTPTLTALPLVSTANHAEIANAVRLLTAARRPWTIALHPTGTLRLQDDDTQAEADRLALTRCRALAAQADPNHCQIVLRGDGRPGIPMRSPTPGQPPRGS